MSMTSRVVCFLVEAGTPCFGNDVLERNLVLVERVGLSRGLPPEAISVMLDYAMSLRMGTNNQQPLQRQTDMKYRFSLCWINLTIHNISALSLPRTGGVTCVRVLKFLIPATVVPQEAVVRAVSWLCVGKIAISTQVKSSSLSKVYKSHSQM